MDAEMCYLGCMTTNQYAKQTEGIVLSGFVMLPWNQRHEA